jgi:hypothetical protein
MMRRSRGGWMRLWAWGRWVRIDTAWKMLRGDEWRASLEAWCLGSNIRSTSIADIRVFPRCGSLHSCLSSNGYTLLLVRWLRDARFKYSSIAMLAFSTPKRRRELTDLKWRVRSITTESSFSWSWVVESIVIHINRYAYIQSSSHSAFCPAPKRRPYVPSIPAACCTFITQNRNL